MNFGLESLFAIVYLLRTKAVNATLMTLFRTSRFRPPLLAYNGGGFHGTSLVLMIIGWSDSIAEQGYIFREWGGGL